MGRGTIGKKRRSERRRYAAKERVMVWRNK